MVWQGVCWLLQALQHHFQNSEFKVFADKVGLYHIRCFPGVWWPPVLCISMSELKFAVVQVLGCIAAV